MKMSWGVSEKIRSSARAAAGLAMAVLVLAFSVSAEAAKHAKKDEKAAAEAEKKAVEAEKKAGEAEQKAIEAEAKADRSGKKGDVKAAEDARAKADKAAAEAEKAREEAGGEAEAPEDPPGPLNKVEVPLPKDLDKYVADRKTAILLGKALFWDMQVGSDGKTACASCHYHAGVDNRTRNTLAPRTGEFRGANYDLQPKDFPFHRLQNPKDADSKVVFDTSEVVGSQGVVKKDFVAISENSPVDKGVLVTDPVFNVDGNNVRQVTGRNAPSVINAVFNDRQFWDGRANRFFNGVDPFGDHNPNARVWKASGSRLSKVRILIDNASLASQAFQTRAFGL